jgi:hypothetical protein
MPNWTIYQRESRLYADIEAYPDGALNWNAPGAPYVGLPFLDSFMPPALRVAAAMEQLGMFTIEGLQAVSDIWGSLEYKDKEDHHDGTKLTERLLQRLHVEGLMLDTAKDEDVATLYQTWQIPMYNLDFSLSPVTLKELEATQEREYLSVGKPVKVRLDNAKAHVKIQMRRALARIGVSFDLSIPHHPDTKPFVERFHGTLETDLIHWLKGSTGSNPADKGDRKPQQEAILTLDDLMELIHQWLIEVYCRRPQLGLDNETPEERWVRGANSPSHRPRVLDATQQAKWDLIPSLELDLVATRNGIRWNNLEFNSLELQRLRREAGYHGDREMKPTPIKAWVPLYDVGTMKVVLSTAIESWERKPKSEITLKSSNPLAHGRKKWEHDVICAFVRSQAKSPKDHASYEDGFRRLFANALSKMGLVQDGEKPAKSIKLTGGQAPRFLGVLDRGAARPALEKTDETMVMFGMFSNLDAHLTKTHDGRTPQSQNAAGDAADAEATQTYDFPVDPILDFIPE